MENNNPWSKIKFDKNTPSVLSELKRFAEELADETDGLLYAEVNPIDAYNEQTFELGIVYNFHVYAPYLANLRILLFTVAEENNKITLINRLTNGREETKTLIALIPKIDALIASDEVKKQLANLYSSSYEVKSVEPKETRQGEKWARAIERDFAVTYWPQSVKVSMKNGTTYHGYFQNFSDFDTLKKDFKFRFVRWNDAKQLRDEYSETNKMNEKYSVVIDCAEVEKIEIEIPEEFMRNAI